MRSSQAHRPPDSSPSGCLRSVVQVPSPDGQMPIPVPKLYSAFCKPHINYRMVHESVPASQPPTLEALATINMAPLITIEDISSRKSFLVL